MRLRRRGLIVPPPAQSGDAVGYAQSPQLLELANHVRIYFSTRKLDTNGKFLSHVAYVDMSKDLLVTHGFNNGEVIPLGGLGAFDEHGIFPFSVTQDSERVFAYTTGWSRRVGVSVETAIGMVESFDGGLTFHRSGPGPILASSLHEPFLVGDAFVRKFDGVYYMWYIFGVRWFLPDGSVVPERVYKIGQASSADGVRFEGLNGLALFPDMIGPDECQALPSVAWFDGLYHMFFCYREAVGFRQQSNRGYRLGYATSSDLVGWDRRDHELGWEGDGDGFDSAMACYPNVSVVEGVPYLLYNGNEFGRHGFGIAEILL